MFAEGEEEVDLVRAAAALATPAYPGLDAEPLIAQLDEWAEAIRRMRLRGSGPEARVSAVNRFFFERLDFYGNAFDYTDPRNSFINDVIARRTGIPVTLSLVYMEVARRLELPIYGVGLPGHFIVKYEGGRRRFFIDPFHDGRVLNRQGVRRLMRQIHGSEVELTDLHFAATTKRQIIVRMAHNLRDLYLSTRQFRKGLEYIDVIIALGDDDPETLRVRAWAHGEIGRKTEYLADMEAFIERRPDSPEAEDARERVMQLKHDLALRN